MLIKTQGKKFKNHHGNNTFFKKLIKLTFITTDTFGVNIVRMVI